MEDRRASLGYGGAVKEPCVTRKQTSAVDVRPTAMGQGLFARQRFGPEQVIGEISGEVIEDPEYGSDYCMHLDDDAKLEPSEPFRYLNHSCEPNCELVLWKSRKCGENRYPRMWLQALRMIQPGDELTIDYGWPADAAIPCRCESPACRGWIVDVEEMPQLLRGRRAH